MTPSEPATTFQQEDGRRLSFDELLAAASAAHSNDGSHAHSSLPVAFPSNAQNHYPFGRADCRAASPFGVLAPSAQVPYLQSGVNSYSDAAPMRHRAASEVSASSISTSPYLGPSSPAPSVHAVGAFVEEPLCMEGDFASLELERAAKAHAASLGGQHNTSESMPKRYDTLSWAKENGVPSREDTMVLGNQASFMTPGTGGLRLKDSVSNWPAAFDEQQQPNREIGAADGHAIAEDHQNNYSSHNAAYSDAPYVNSPSSSPSASVAFPTEQRDAPSQRPQIPTIRAPSGPLGPAGATSPPLRLDMTHPALAVGPSISLTSATPLTARPETQRSGTLEFQRVLESLARERKDAYSTSSSSAQSGMPSAPSHLFVDAPSGRPRVRQRSKSDSGATDLNYLAQLGIVPVDSSMANMQPQYNSGAPANQESVGEWTGDSPAFLADPTAATSLSYSQHPAQAWTTTPWPTQMVPFPGNVYGGASSAGMLPSVQPVHWPNMGFGNDGMERQNSFMRTTAEMTTGNHYQSHPPARRTLSAGGHRRGRSDGSLPVADSTQMFMHNGMLTAPGVQAHNTTSTGVWLPGSSSQNAYDATTPSHMYGSPSYQASSPSAVSLASGGSQAGSHPGSPYIRERSWSHSSMGSAHGSLHETSHMYGGLSPGASSTGYIDYQSKTTAATKAAAAKRRKEGVEARYICDMCGESFTRAYNLKGHQRAHKGEKPFHCGYPGCDKSFARQHDRKRHYKLHLGVKDYNCGACGKAFIRLDALQRHLRADAGQSCYTQLRISGDPLPAGLDLDTIRDLSEVGGAMNVLTNRRQDEIPQMV